MDLNTWVSLAALAVFAIAMFTYLDKKFENLNEKIGAVDAKVDKVEAKVDTARDGLRAEVKSDIDNLTTIVLRLDERVYDLATGNRPRPLIVPPH